MQVEASRIYVESEEEPPGDDESRGQSDGAGSSMSSDGSENEEDWHAGSEPHRHAGTHNLWLVDDHTTGDKVRQARLKTGASYPDLSREDSDSKRHADQELTALRIQFLAKRRSDSAQAHSDPEAARRLLERDEKELRDFDFSFGTFRKNIECQDQGDLRTRKETCENEWMKVRNGCKSILHFGPRAFWKPGNGTEGKR